MFAIIYLLTHCVINLKSTTHCDVKQDELGHIKCDCFDKFFRNKVKSLL
jgi:hypothetical protein